MLQRRIIYSILFCLYIAAVAYICFARPEDIPQLPDIWPGLPSDKVVHFLMFIPYTILGFIIFYPSEGNVWKQVMLIAVLLVTGMGMAIGIEQIQALLSYRSAETDDIAADAAGLAAGALTTLMYMMNRRKR